MKYVAPFGAETQEESFIDGIPEYGIEGSAVPAESIEHPQREIVEVIKQAGLNPSGDDLTQLWQAIVEIVRVRVPLATLEKPGILYPDGRTCTVDAKGKLTQLPGGQWFGDINYLVPCMVLQDGRIFIWQKPSGPDFAGVGAVQPGTAGGALYWLNLETHLYKLANWHRIGRREELETDVLPPDCVWANRDAVYFDDWPWFKEKYLAGGLGTMVLPATATEAEKSTMRGKWVLLPNGEGLLTPDWRDLFVRGWCPGGSGEAGKWGRDEIRNIVAVWSRAQNAAGCVGTVSGAATVSDYDGDGAQGNLPAAAYRTWGLDASIATPTGPITVPPHINAPVALYMGTPATTPIPI